MSMRIGHVSVTNRISVVPNGHLIYRPLTPIAFSLQTQLLSHCGNVDQIVCE
jgi:hypothetical protein